MISWRTSYILWKLTKIWSHEPICYPKQWEYLSLIAIIQNSKNTSLIALIQNSKNTSLIAIIQNSKNTSLIALIQNSKNTSLK